MEEYLDKRAVKEEIVDKKEQEVNQRLSEFKQEKKAYK